MFIVRCGLWIRGGDNQNFQYDQNVLLYSIVVVKTSKKNSNSNIVKTTIKIMALEAINYCLFPDRGEEVGSEKAECSCSRRELLLDRPPHVFL